MHIRHIPNNGHIDRPGDPSPRLDREKAARKGATETTQQDVAAISSDGQKMAEVARAFAERLKQEEPGQGQRLQELADRLGSGALDSQEVFKATARKLLSSGFGSDWI